MNGDAGKTCAKSKQETWFHHSVDSYGELIFAAELRGHDIGEFVTLHPLGKKKVRLAGRLRRLAKIGAMRVPQTSHEATFLCWSLKLSADSWFLFFSGYFAIFCLPLHNRSNSCLLSIPNLDRFTSVRQPIFIFCAQMAHMAQPPPNIFSGPCVNPLCCVLAFQPSFYRY